MMPAHTRTTATTFIKNYTMDKSVPGSPSERMARFLHDFSEEYPGDFVSRQLVVKIGHNLLAVPRDNNDAMKRCSYHIRQAEKLLQKRHQQHIVSDRVQGYRATTSSNDVHDTKYKRSLQRQAVATRAAVAVANTIDPHHLTGSRKEEFLRTRGALRGIEGHLDRLLPPKKD